MNQIAGFIIPARGETTTATAYQKTGEFLTENNVLPVFIDIDWAVGGAAEWLDEARKKTEAYQRDYSPSHMLFIGFVEGAVLALTLAAEVEAKGVILCSLPPCYTEDLDNLSKINGLTAPGKFFRQNGDCNYPPFEKLFNSHVFMLVGEKEKGYLNTKILSYRKKWFPGSELIFPRGIGAKFDHDAYLAAISLSIRMCNDLINLGYISEKNYLKPVLA